MRVPASMRVAAMLVAALLAVGLLGPWRVQGTAPPRGRVRAGEVLVQLRAGAGSAAVARRTGTSVAASVSPHVQRVAVPPGQEQAMLAKLRADRDVEVAALSYTRTAIDVTPNDPQYPQQWWLPQISAPAAW